ncbi:hypothetical protein MSG28_014317 [Choristoneura fumiferana]|uniref:Uncharacterized protein n=1 Tax=Choristoneura fumiferana TaxID=7141 RepID=A0ACC0JHJ1_CHOFU|nr:hypothetical protein MSG28_014317 [Choristoneura fumiferana]
MQPRCGLQTGHPSLMMTNMMMHYLPRTRVPGSPASPDYVVAAGWLLSDNPQELGLLMIVFKTRRAHLKMSLHSGATYAASFSVCMWTTFMSLRLPALPTAVIASSKGAGVAAAPCANTVCPGRRGVRALVGAQIYKMTSMAWHNHKHKRHDTAEAEYVLFYFVYSEGKHCKETSTSLRGNSMVCEVPNPHWARVGTMAKPYSERRAVPSSGTFKLGNVLPLIPLILSHRLLPMSCMN